MFQQEMAAWRHEQHILGTMLLFYDWVPEVNVQESQAESDIELPHQMHGGSHMSFNINPPWMILAGTKM